jgi:hypothetical protein
MTTESKTVLLCGGPADGRWVVVPGDSREWNVVEIDHPGPVRVADPLEIPDPVLHTYRLYQEHLFTGTLWIGIRVTDARDYANVVMKAVLQRDVAAHLGAYR